MTEKGEQLNKLIYYRSEKLIEQFFEKSDFQIRNLNFSYNFFGFSIDCEKKKNNLLKKFKNIKFLHEKSLKINEYYKFSSFCTLKRVVNDDCTFEVEIEISLQNSTLKSETSVENWISKSNLNNLIKVGKIELEGILKILSIPNDSNNIIIQFILIGEKGLFDNNE